jgi:DNA-binding HxlR family transcriptional regulator
MTGATPHVSPVLARALAARLRDAVHAADRLASFAFVGEAEGTPSTQMADGEEVATAQDFVLRTFHAACERTNHQIIAAAIVAGDKGATVDRLAADIGLTRMALLERVHELIQLGLVGRDLPRDTIRATAAGEGLLELMSELGTEVVEWVRQRRRS